MPAIKSEIVAAEDEGVEIRSGLRAVGLVAEGIETVYVAPRIPGNTDPDNYETIAGTRTVVGADLVVVAIGQRPDTSILRRREAVPASSDRFQVDIDTGGTAYERIFAAGDLTGDGGTITAAIAGGLRAAWGLDRSLRGPTKADERPPPPRVTLTPPAGRPGVTRVEAGKRATAPELDPTDRVKNYGEVVGVFTEQQARMEAARCMICGLCGNCNACLDLFGCPAFYIQDGLIEIDPVLCVVCGVCAQFCPNDAIHPVTQPATVGES
jgi:NADPH-dependent glutamate synthase beta subunit-like oxidoreductase